MNQPRDRLCWSRVRTSAAVVVFGPSMMTLGYGGSSQPALTEDQPQERSHADAADIEVRVLAIPDDWRAPVKGDFQQETMISLSELGRELGADPSSWSIWAAPSSE